MSRLPQPPLQAPVVAVLLGEDIQSSANSPPSSSENWATATCGCRAARRRSPRSRPTLISSTSCSPTSLRRIVRSAGLEGSGSGVPSPVDHAGRALHSMFHLRRRAVRQEDQGLPCSARMKQALVAAGQSRAELPSPRAPVPLARNVDAPAMGEEPDELGAAAPALAQNWPTLNSPLSRASVTPASPTWLLCATTTFPALSPWRTCRAISAVVATIRRSLTFQLFAPVNAAL